MDLVDTHLVIKNYSVMVLWFIWLFAFIVFFNNFDEICKSANSIFM